MTNNNKGDDSAGCTPSQWDWRTRKSLLPNSRREFGGSKSSAGVHQLKSRPVWSSLIIISIIYKVTGYSYFIIFPCELDGPVDPDEDDDDSTVS